MIERETVPVVMVDLADNIVAHYEKHALAWEAERRNLAWNDRPPHERFVGSLAPGAKVLDLGCGAAFPVAANMCTHGLQVTGVDSSPTMISLCRERLPDQEWIVADMRNLSLGRRFDGVLAWDSFFHLDHDSQREMFAVFADHASPGALLMFNTGTELGEAIGEYRGDPLYHASLGPDEYHSLIAGAGFQTLEHRVEDQQAGGRTIWLCCRR